VLGNANRRSKLEMRGTIVDKYSQSMLYAADVVIMGRRLQVFTSLVEETNKMELE